jgi:hypothetical protein
VRDVFDYSFHLGKIVYAFQIYMYGVQKLNKFILYYFYTYIFDGNLAPDCGPGTDCSSTHIIQCVLERIDTITNEVLEPITSILAYPTVFLSCT